MKDSSTDTDAYCPPAGWLYIPLRTIACLILKLLFGVRIRRDPQLFKHKGPLIVLGNHPSNLDPLILALALPDRRVHFLTTDYFFRNPFYSRLLKKLAAIPKQQFRTDTRAARSMFQIIQHGGTLAVYPEGQRSLDGGLCPIDDSIAKMINKTRCPVAIVRENGACLTWPRWSKSGFRPGRIDVETRLLFSADELTELTVNQIRQEIEKALTYNDYAWQLTNMKRFFSLAPAFGLHNLCHQCPACRKILIMKSSRSGLFCQSCGFQVRLDCYGYFKLLPGREIHEATVELQSDPWHWHQWQLRQTRQKMNEPDFLLTFPAFVDQLDKDGIEIPIGPGQLRLTGKNIEFRSDAVSGKTDSHFELKIPYRSRTGLSFDYGAQFELAAADQIYRFRPEPGQAIGLIVDAILVAGKIDTA